MTKHVDSELLNMYQLIREKIEKVTEFKYLGDKPHTSDTTKEEICARFRAAWSCFEKTQGNTSK